MRLAEFVTPSTRAAVSALVPEDEIVWVGLAIYEESENFRWLSGTSLGGSGVIWGPAEDADGECAGFYVDSANDRYTQDDCSVSRRFICESVKTVLSHTVVSEYGSTSVIATITPSDGTIYYDTGGNAPTANPILEWAPGDTTFYEKTTATLKFLGTRQHWSDSSIVTVNVDMGRAKLDVAVTKLPNGLQINATWADGVNIPPEDLPLIRYRPDDDGEEEDWTNLTITSENYWRDLELIGKAKGWETFTLPLETPVNVLELEGGQFSEVPVMTVWPTSGFSFAGWFKWESAASQTSQTLLHYKSASSQLILWAGVPPAACSFDASMPTRPTLLNMELRDVNGGENFTATAVTFENVGNWQHIAVTLSAAGAVKFYVDGLFHDGWSFLRGPMEAGGRLWIGANQNEPAWNIPGLSPCSTLFAYVADVQIWSRAMEADEVLDLMFEVPQEDAFGLVAYWSFNDDPDLELALDWSLNELDMNTENAVVEENALPFVRVFAPKVSCVTRDNGYGGHHMSIRALPSAVTVFGSHQQAFAFSSPEFSPVNTGETLLASGAHSWSFVAAQAGLLNSKVEVLGGMDAVMSVLAIKGVYQVAKSLSITTFPTDALTACIWFFYEGPSSKGFATILSFATGPTRTNEWIMHLRPIQDLVCLSRVTYHACAPVPKIHDKQWLHFCAEWCADDGRVVLFLNNEKIVDSYFLSDLPPLLSSGALCIGQEQDGLGTGFEDGQGFDGYLYDLRIWDRLLSGPDVAAEMGESAVNSTGLVMHYALSQEDGADTIVGLVGTEAVLGLFDNASWVMMGFYAVPQVAMELSLSPVNGGQRLSKGPDFAYQYYVPFRDRALLVGPTLPGRKISPPILFGWRGYHRYSVGNFDYGRETLFLPVQQLKPVMVLEWRGDAHAIADMPCNCRFPDGDFTVSYWAQHHLGSPHKPVLFSVEDGAAGRTLLTLGDEIGSKTIEFFAYDSTEVKQSFPARATSAAWHHYVAVFVEALGVLTVSVDEEFLGSISPFVALDPSSNCTVRLGQRSLYSPLRGQDFPGLLRELQVWSEAKAVSETLKPYLRDVPASLVFFWPVLEEDIGTGKIRDKSRSDPVDVVLSNVDVVLSNVDGFYVDRVDPGPRTVNVWNGKTVYIEPFPATAEVRRNIQGKYAQTAAPLWSANFTYTEYSAVRISFFGRAPGFCSALTPPISLAYSRYPELSGSSAFFSPAVDHWPSGSFSISAWTRSTGECHYSVCNLVSYYVNGTTEFQLSTSGPWYHVKVHGCLMVTSIDMSYNDLDDGWHFLTFTLVKESGRIVYYVDGEKVAEETPKQIECFDWTMSSPGEVLIGSASAGISKPWIGSILRVSVYSGVLTAAQVVSQYTQVSPNSTSLVLSWMLFTNLETSTEPALKEQVHGVSYLQEIGEPVSWVEFSPYLLLSDYVRLNRTLTPVVGGYLLNVSTEPKSATVAMFSTAPGALASRVLADTAPDLDPADRFPENGTLMISSSMEIRLEAFAFGYLPSATVLGGQDFSTSVMGVTDAYLSGNYSIASPEYSLTAWVKAAPNIPGQEMTPIPIWLLDQDFDTKLCLMLKRNYVWTPSTSLRTNVMPTFCGAESAAPEPPWAGRWVHVAMTFDGSSLRLHANGKLLYAVAAASAADLGDPFILALGGSLLGGAYSFSGELAELRIFNKTLSLAEVVTDFESSDSVSNLGDLAGYFKLNRFEAFGVADELNPEAQLANTGSSQLVNDSLPSPSIVVDTVVLTPDVLNIPGGRRVEVMTTPEEATLFCREFRRVSLEGSGEPTEDPVWNRVWNGDAGAGIETVPFALYSDLINTTSATCPSKGVDVLDADPRVFLFFSTAKGYLASSVSIVRVAVYVRLSPAPSCSQQGMAFQFVLLRRNQFDGVSTGWGSSTLEIETFRGDVVTIESDQPHEAITWPMPANDPFCGPQPWKLCVKIVSVLHGINAGGFCMPYFNQDGCLEPKSSCDEIRRVFPTALSGFYWLKLLQNGTREFLKAYCDMSGPTAYTTVLQSIIEQSIPTPAWAELFNSSVFLPVGAPGITGCRCGTTPNCRVVSQRWDLNRGNSMMVTPSVWMQFGDLLEIWAGNGSIPTLSEAHEISISSGLVMSVLHSPWNASSTFSALNGSLFGECGAPFWGNGTFSPFSLKWNERVSVNWMVMTIRPGIASAEHCQTSSACIDSLCLSKVCVPCSPLCPASTRCSKSDVCASGLCFDHRCHGGSEFSFRRLADLTSGGREEQLLPPGQATVGKDGWILSASTGSTSGADYRWLPSGPLTGREMYFYRLGHKEASLGFHLNSTVVVTHLEVFVHIGSGNRGINSSTDLYSLKVDVHWQNGTSKTVFSANARSMCNARLCKIPSLIIPFGFRVSDFTITATTYVTPSLFFSPIRVHVMEISEDLCSNNVRNEAEADVDCGGVCPVPCIAGKRCLVDEDCQEGFWCTASQCKSAEPVMDRVFAAINETVPVDISTCGEGYVATLVLLPEGSFVSVTRDEMAIWNCTVLNASLASVSLVSLTGETRLVVSGTATASSVVISFPMTTEYGLAPKVHPLLHTSGDGVLFHFILPVGAHVQTGFEQLFWPRSTFSAALLSVQSGASNDSLVLHAAGESSYIGETSACLSRRILNSSSLTMNSPQSLTGYCLASNNATRVFVVAFSLEVAVEPVKLWTATASGAVGVNFVSVLDQEAAVLGGYWKGKFSASGIAEVLSETQDAFVLKLSGELRPQWLVPVGGGGNDTAVKGAIDSAGGVLAVVWFRACDCTIGRPALAALPCASAQNIGFESVSSVLLKFKSDGSLQWWKSMRGTSSEPLLLLWTSLVLSHDGQAIIGGTVCVSNSSVALLASTGDHGLLFVPPFGCSGLLLGLQADGDGDQLWQRQFGAGRPESAFWTALVGNSQDGLTVDRSALLGEGFVALAIPFETPGRVVALFLSQAGGEISSLSSIVDNELVLSKISIASNDSAVLLMFEADLNNRPNPPLLISQMVVSFPLLNGDYVVKSHHQCPLYAFSPGRSILFASSDSSTWSVFDQNVTITTSPALPSMRFRSAMETGGEVGRRLVQIPSPPFAFGATMATVAVPSGGLCGNGVVDASESCDDGNFLDGDGCSSACAVENGWRCSVDASKVSTCCIVPLGPFGPIAERSDENKNLWALSASKVSFSLGVWGTGVFTALGPASTMVCDLVWLYSLNDGEFKETDQEELSFENLKEDDYALIVKVVISGNVSEPVSRIWRIDNSAPSVTILCDVAANSVTNNSEPAFTFHLDDPEGAYVQFRRDDASWNVLGGIPSQQTAPLASIEEFPDAKSADSDAFFRFSHAGGTSDTWQYVYKVDSDPWVPLVDSEELLLSGLDEGRHMLLVSVSDAAGVANSRPKFYSWVVDLRSPAVSFSATPQNSSYQSGTYQFGFASDEEPASFLCALDGVKAPLELTRGQRDAISDTLAPCAPAMNFTGLKLGWHAIFVRSLDGVRRRSALVDYQWVVGPPDPVLVSTPPLWVTAASVEYVVSLPTPFGEETTELECAVATGISQVESWENGLEFTPCPLADTISSLQEGPMGVWFRSAANADGAKIASPPILARWTVKPRLTCSFAVRPGAQSFSRIAAFMFASNEANVRYQYSLDDGEWVEQFDEALVLQSLSEDLHNLRLKSFNATTSEESDIEIARWQVTSEFRVTTNAQSEPWEDGRHTMFARGVDFALNQQDPPAAFAFSVDTVPPNSSITDLPVLTFTNSSVPVLHCFGETDPCVFEVELDSGNFTTTVSANSVTNQAAVSLPVLSDGVHFLSVVATDKAGNRQVHPTVLSFKVDTHAPFTFLEYRGDVLTRQTFAEFHLSCDDLSGCERYSVVLHLANGTVKEWYPAGNLSASNSDAVYVLPDVGSDGPHSLCCSGIDLAGNVGNQVCVNWTTDTVAPVSTIEASPSGLYRKPDVSFAFSCDDELPCSYIWSLWKQLSSGYSLRNSGSISANAASEVSTTIASAGLWKLEILAQDQAGNTEAVAVVEEWIMDDEIPTPTLTTNIAGIFSSSLEPWFSVGCDDDNPECELSVLFDKIERPVVQINASTPHVLLEFAVEDGPHAFALWAKDAAGNVNTLPKNVTFLVDSKNPTLHLEVSPPPWTNVGLLSFQVAAADDNVASVKYRSSVWSAATGHVYEALESSLGTFSLPVSFETNYTVTIDAEDGAGNSATPIVRHIVFDATAPRLAVMSPISTNVTLNSSIFKISAACSDVQLSCVVKYKMDSAILWIESSEPFSLAASEFLFNGVHRIWFLAEDLAHNTNFSSLYWVTVDTIDPELTLMSGDHLSGAHENTTSLLFEVECVDLTPCSIVIDMWNKSTEGDGSRSWSSASVVLLSVSETETGGMSVRRFQVSDSVPSPGDWVLAVSAQDSAGHRVTNAAFAEVEVDLTVPSAVFVSPAFFIPPHYVGNSSLPIVLSCPGERGCEYWIYLDQLTAHKDRGNIDCPCCTCDTSGNSSTGAATTLGRWLSIGEQALLTFAEDGEYRVSALSRDLAGNVQVLPTELDAFFVDTVPPLVSFSKSPKTSSLSTVEVQLSIVDPNYDVDLLPTVVSAKFLLDDALEALRTDPATFQEVLEITDLTAAHHKITAMVEDAAGNVREISSTWTRLASGPVATPTVSYNATLGTEPILVSLEASQPDCTFEWRFSGDPEWVKIVDVPVVSKNNRTYTTFSIPVVHQSLGSQQVQFRALDAADAAGNDVTEELVFTCPVGWISRTNSHTCSPCYAGTNSLSKTECSPCAVGTFSRPQNDNCQTCPTNGAECPGGILVLSEGYVNFNKREKKWTWYSDDVDNTTVFFPCLEPYHCPVVHLSNITQQTTCGPNRRGLLCSECSDEHALLGENCSKCWTSQAVAWLSLVGVILAMILGSAFLVWRSFSSKSTLSILLRIVINFLQLNTILGMYRVRGPQAFREMMGMADVADGISFNSFPIMCKWHLSFESQLVGYVLLPVIVLVLPGLLFTALYFVRKSMIEGEQEQLRWKKKLKTLYSVTVVVLFFLMHARISKAIFKAFHCYQKDLPDENGHWGSALKEQLSLACYAPYHSTVAIIGLLGFTIGVPVFAVWFLRKNRDKLKDPDFKHAYGFMYDGYDLEHWYWYEALVLLRKIVLTAIVVFLDTDYFMSAYAASWLVAGSLVLHMKAFPYNQPVLNWMEALSLGATLITQMGSMVYLSHENLNIEITVLLTTVNFATLILFVGIGVRTWSIERRKKREHFFARREGKVDENGIELSWGFNPMVVSTAAHQPREDSDPDMEQPVLRPVRARGRRRARGRGRVVRRPKERRGTALLKDRGMMQAAEEPGAMAELMRCADLNIQRPSGRPLARSRGGKS